jgi:drug/metabolite transporter (DMT)-like permease
MQALKSIALNGILIAIVAQALIGISLVWDKVLLKQKSMGSLVSYVFWLGAISIFGLVLIPFGFHMPAWKTVGVAVSAGFCDLLATYFYYSALKSGEASEELAAMGGFSPVVTVLFAIPLLGAKLHGEFIGFILMSGGGFVMFFAEKLPLRKMLPRILAAAVFFGLTNVLQKIAFDQAKFISGYVFFTIGTFLGAVALLMPPAWRHQIMHPPKEAGPRSRTGYFFNRFLAGVGSFLVVFAVSRANPAVVEAISGVRYVVIFIGAFAITHLRPSWFKEDFSQRAVVIKVAATALVIAGLVLVGMHGGGNTGSGPN